MISASWLTPETVQTLGWTLVHFVWEGAVLALLLYVIFAFAHSARVRYTAAVIALLLMVASPIATFAILQNRPALTTDAGSAHQVIASLQVAAKLALDNSVGSSHASLPSIDWLGWLVWAWFGGVLVFALRALGGWLVLERVHRKKSEPLTAVLRNRCLQLQERLALTRTVRYFQSRLVEVPAVMGWFRPVVLIPAAAMTGLSPQQLEAVIAHELAHIKRLDCFVNLFQIAAETVLFYHPAVWWVSKAIRNERENCCDDVAVSICGNPGDYARALAAMEIWRATPALMLAMNSASLRSRVGRLLGVETITRSIPRSGLAAVGVLCAAGVLLAATTANRVFNDLPDSEEAQAQEGLPGPPAAPAVPAIEESFATSCIRPATAVRVEAVLARVVPDANGSGEAAQDPQPVSNNEGGDKQSYIAGLQAAGLKDLTVDQIIALKVQGVTPEYIREMRSAGFDTSINNLVAMKVQGITPEYLKEIRASGLKPDTHDLIALKVQGVTPEYVNKVRSEYGNDVTVHQIIAMKVQGLDPSQAAEFKKLGLADISLNKLIALKVQGVTPDYVRALEAAGFKDLKTGDILAAKVQGITPEFIQQVRSHGFNNVTMHQLIELKVAGIF